MSRGATDWLASVEAAYDLDATDEKWVEGLARSIAPLLGRGRGTTAWLYDVRDESRPKIGPLVVLDGPPQFFGLPTEFLERFGERAATAAYRGVRAVETGRNLFRAMGIESTLWDEWTGELGVRDFIAMRSSPTAPVGVLVGAPQPEPVELVAPTRTVLARIAAHLGAAFRLRQLLTRPSAAVLTSGGKLVDATPGTENLREALRHAVRARERARTRHARRDSISLELWPALVSGRFSLLDQFDSDGRRHVVAVANPVGTRTEHALSPREAEVAALAAQELSNKLIAYHLGIAESTVATLLSRALRRLRLRRRADLCALAPALPLPSTN